jgi:putative addiction module killer protein
MRVEKEVMANMFDIEVYRTSEGKEPYTEWAESLDKNALVRIDARITRIEKTGNFGICEPVGDGVFELKLDFGPGYRIYFGYKTDAALVLLFGGHKKRQQKDIDKAHEYWREYLSLKRGEK